MARFINTGSGKKAVFEIDTEASTSPNPHGTAKKAAEAANADKVAEAEQAKSSKIEGAK